MKETACTAIKYLVKALANYSVVGVPFADPLGDLAESAVKDWWESYFVSRPPAERNVDLQSIGQASSSEIRAAIADDLARITDPSLRSRIETYVAAVPSAISASLRRPSDPEGRTIPAALILQSASDLFRFMPSRLPRFKAGDRPNGVGDLELVELLGAGGFGEVWLARNPNMPSQQLALKFCLDPAAAASLRSETRLLENLRKSAAMHAGIVPLLHTFLAADPPCLGYEYVPGTTLASLILIWHRERSGPTPTEAARVILRIAEIMAPCHAQQPSIVHRDLKPANILVPQASGDDGMPRSCLKTCRLQKLVQ